MSTELTPMPFPAHGGRTLLGLARNAIATRLGVDAAPAAEEDWLRSNGATFVTLKQKDQLRGCIGTLQAHRGLGDDVRANAVAAAFSDPRFSPLTRDEYGSLNVEVSLLSALERVAFRDEDDALQQLRPLIDGVIFEYGHHRSTFLPQVWDDFSDARLFIGHLKYKAGLPPDFWDEAVKLSRYTVSKWREGEGT